jgi:pimeloyl-ACP methyl ester carboxylesterase
VHYYILSGLGADEKVFEKLQFPEPYTHLKWLKNKPTESLSLYAKRMAKRIEDPKNAVLIGLSFGGIVAQEIAAQLAIPQIILLNTVKHRKEIPWYMRFAGNVGLHRLLPMLYTRPNMDVANYFFGIKSREEKLLMQQLMKGMDTAHIEWAVDKILKWRGVNHGAKVVHIHSRNDKIFPLRFVQADIVIPGGHFAVFNLTKLPI